MTKITFNEVESLARASRIKLDKEEIAKVASSIDEVLQYIEIIKEVNFDQSENSLKSMQTCNIFREDETKQENIDMILANGPQVTANAFVVPSILNR